MTKIHIEFNNNNGIIPLVPLIKIIEHLWNTKLIIGDDQSPLKVQWKFNLLLVSKNFFYVISEHLQHSLIIPPTRFSNNNTTSTFLTNITQQNSILNHIHTVKCSISDLNYMYKVLSHHEQRPQQSRLQSILSSFLKDNSSELGKSLYNLFIREQQQIDADIQQRYRVKELYLEEDSKIQVSETNLILHKMIAEYFGGLEVLTFRSVNQKWFGGGAHIEMEEGTVPLLPFVMCDLPSVKCLRLISLNIGGIPPHIFSRFDTASSNLRQLIIRSAYIYTSSDIKPFLQSIGKLKRLEYLYLRLTSQLHYIDFQDHFTSTILFDENDSNRVALPNLHTLKLQFSDQLNIDERFIRYLGMKHDSYGGSQSGSTCPLRYFSYVGGYDNKKDLLRYLLEHEFHGIEKTKIYIKKDVVSSNPEDTGVNIYGHNTERVYLESGWPIIPKGHSLKSVACSIECLSTEADSKIQKMITQFSRLLKDSSITELAFFNQYPTEIYKALDDSIAGQLVRLKLSAKPLVNYQSSPPLSMIDTLAKCRNLEYLKLRIESSKFGDDFIAQLFDKAISLLPVLKSVDISGPPGFISSNLIDLLIEKYDSKFFIWFNKKDYSLKINSRF